MVWLLLEQTLEEEKGADKKLTIVAVNAVNLEDVEADYFQAYEKQLQNSINNLNPKFKNVIEFRHESWWIDKVWDLFMKNNITF